jgi:MerR family transcriptional regulator/heat shock protein HspR
MTRRIIPREKVADELAVSPGALLRYETLGLVQSVHEGSVVGYEPAEIRRLWTIVSFQRDLGINLAGVQVILRLFDQLTEVHHRVHDLAEELHDLIDQDDSPIAPSSHG